MKVSERYLRNLESGARNSLTVAERNTAEPRARDEGAPKDGGSGCAQSEEQMLEGCGAEEFVLKLQELSRTRSPPDVRTYDTAKLAEEDSVVRYTYSRLNFDFSRKSSVWS